MRSRFLIISVPYLDQGEIKLRKKISLFLFHRVSFSCARVLPSYHIYLLTRLVVAESKKLPCSIQLWVKTIASSTRSILLRFMLGIGNFVLDSSEL